MTRPANYKPSQISHLKRVWHDCTGHGKTSGWPTYSELGRQLGVSADPVKYVGLTYLKALYEDKQCQLDFGGCLLFDCDHFLADSECVCLCEHANVHVCVMLYAHIVIADYCDVYCSVFMFSVNLY